LLTKKCRIYAACGVSQTPTNLLYKKGGRISIIILPPKIKYCTYFTFFKYTLQLKNHFFSFHVYLINKGNA
ncbi:MAG: hypothetical protein ACI4F4_10410, partial [Lachnospiraceae bacterium]